jgi:uracil-DNA glycosylase family 4
MSHNLKQGRYRALVESRKVCDLCGSNLENPSKCNKQLDSDQIGPWSIWQGNLDAKIMIIGQDWGDTAYYLNNKGRDRDDNPTNRRLRELLGSIDIHIPLLTETNQNNQIVFLTNAILCLKTDKEKMQAKVENAWFENCGRKFLKPTIDTIHPEIIITLGKFAFRSIATLYKVSTKAKFRDFVELSDGIPLYSYIRLFPMYHCGNRIINTWRKLDAQKRDWAKIKRFAAECLVDGSE